MVKPVYRRKSIGTKVSEEEYARLEALAGRQARPSEETLLAEVLALRTILLNAFYKLAQGAKLTAEDMQELIDHADANKVQKAIEKLAAKPGS